MKTYLQIFIAVSILWVTSRSTDSFAGHHIKKTEVPADTISLPACIKKLNRAGSKAIRSYNGAVQYRGSFTTLNGRTVFAFHNEASIGCNSNEPAGTKYYNDSCRLVAKFPGRFSIRQGFKPFIAAGYAPEDFSESSVGDYPLYFAGLKKQQQEKAFKENIKDPFPKEKIFRIGKISNDQFNFKTGDMIKISTKNGLAHFRNGKLLNNYKIVPQLAVIKVEAKCRVAPCFTTETTSLVYFVAAAQRFIDIRNDQFMMSVSTQSDANSPAEILPLLWKQVCELKEHQ